MKHLLISWIGEADLKTIGNNKINELGPVAQAAISNEYSEIALLTDYPLKKANKYIEWLQKQTSSIISLNIIKLTDPTDFEQIYEAAIDHISQKQNQYREKTLLTFHTSPGTPQMGAVWIILSTTKYPANLIKSSKKHGVKKINLPFEISVDFIPDLLRKRDLDLEKRIEGRPLECPEFKEIIHRSNEMQRVIQKAKKIALRSISVIIEGESGTGKELMSRAIHQSSNRKGKPFIAVNCGAIPPEIIESELFGHEKGAFTGAVKTRKGLFETADSGTLFLDEIGDLPFPAQVKLLRVLQEDEITRIGSSSPTRIDVRIIAATNQSLIDETAKGNFREDLFYRLAVAVLKIPPLRNREGDINLLVDYFLQKINKDNSNEPSFHQKKISAKGRNLMLQHLWPGNVRELNNTLQRAAVWSEANTLSEQDINEAILAFPASQAALYELNNLPIGNGLDLQSIISQLAIHYLKGAMEKTNNNKTKAAELLGLSSYQTLTNWLKKYNIE